MPSFRQGVPGTTVCPGPVQATIGAQGRTVLVKDLPRGCRCWQGIGICHMFRAPSDSPAKFRRSGAPELPGGFGRLAHQAMLAPKRRALSIWPLSTGPYCRETWWRTRMRGHELVPKVLIGLDLFERHWPGWERFTWPVPWVTNN